MKDIIDVMSRSELRERTEAEDLAIHIMERPLPLLLPPLRKQSIAKGLNELRLTNEVRFYGSMGICYNLRQELAELQ
jgi:hypothetical protein